MYYVCLANFCFTWSFTNNNVSKEVENAFQVCIMDSWIL